MTLALLQRIIVGFLSLIATGRAQSDTPAKPPEPALRWINVTDCDVEGRDFRDLERLRWFDRFPAMAEGKVTVKVWDLSRDSAGMVVRFKTDATLFWVDYTLLKEKLTIANKTAIAASGLDFYAKDEAGKWRWVEVARPDSQVVRQQIIAEMAPVFREYAVYLPLFNGIEQLSIGIPPDARFEKMPPRAKKPVVFYGTSITHGASASRPGMVHTAILGRRLDVPVTNLGFGGNGTMDLAVGELLARIDAAAYVIDCLPNMDAPLVRERCIPLIHLLRNSRPDIPILLVEDRRNTNAWILPKRDQHHSANHAALRECYDALLKEGVANLYYLAGDQLLGDDGEGSTDGSHPNDLGFVRQAEQFEPVLRTMLSRKATTP